MDPTGWTLTEAAAHLARGDIGAEELAQACLDRIARLNPRLRAFVAVEAESALAEARARDAARAGGGLPGPLHGVPLAHKDMYHRAGVPCECGARLRAGFVPRDTSPLMARLAAAGAVTLGRLHMAEFAMSPTGDNAHLGPCANPWDPARVTGGSSSGSGSAVAARLVYGALGSDTGGSVRLPAAMCGVVGLKPTQHLLPTEGMMPLSDGLDCPGPLARSSRDVARLMTVLGGGGFDYEAELDRPLAGLTLGVPDRFWADDLHPEVAATFDAARAAFAALGVRVAAVPAPDASRLGDLANLVWVPEAATRHLPWLRERPQDYGPQVRARLLQGLAVAAPLYLQARQFRALALREMLEGPLAACDALITPVLRRPVPRREETDVAAGEGMAAVLAELAALTRPVSFLGLPALTTPMGFDAAGMPIGLQLIGRPRAEGTLLALGDAFERSAGWGARAPAIG